MSIFKAPKAVTALISGQPIQCSMCRFPQFIVREMKISTTGAALFGFDWANESAQGLVCINCGMIHPFVGGLIDIIDVEAS